MSVKRLVISEFRAFHAGSSGGCWSVSVSRDPEGFVSGYTLAYTTPQGSNALLMTQRGRVKIYSSLDTLVGDVRGMAGDEFQLAFTFW